MENRRTGVDTAAGQAPNESAAGGFPEGRSKKKH